MRKRKGRVASKSVTKQNSNKARQEQQKQAAKSFVQIEKKVKEESVQEKQEKSKQKKKEWNERKKQKAWAKKQQQQPEVTTSLPAQAFQQQPDVTTSLPAQVSSISQEATEDMRAVVMKSSAKISIPGKTLPTVHFSSASPEDNNNVQQLQEPKQELLAEYHIQDEDVEKEGSQDSDDDDDEEDLEKDQEDCAATPDVKPTHEGQGINNYIRMGEQKYSVEGKQEFKLDGVKYKVIRDQKGSCVGFTPKVVGGTIKYEVPGLICHTNMVGDVTHYEIDMGYVNKLNREEYENIKPQGSLDKTDKDTLCNELKEKGSAPASCCWCHCCILTHFPIFHIGIDCNKGKKFTKEAVEQLEQVGLVTDAAQKKKEISCIVAKHLWPVCKFLVPPDIDDIADFSACHLVATKLHIPREDHFVWWNGTGDLRKDKLGPVKKFCADKLGQKRSGAAQRMKAKFLGAYPIACSNNR